MLLEMMWYNIINYHYYYNIYKHKFTVIIIILLKTGYLCWDGETYSIVSFLRASS